MIELIMLGRKHGYGELQQAVAQALELGCSDVGAVRLLLHAESCETRGAPEPVEIGALSCYDRPLPQVDEYDQLLRNWSGEGVIQ